jgi:hypothetical protein
MGPTDEGESQRIEDLMISLKRCLRKCKEQQALLGPTPEINSNLVIAHCR